MEDKQSIIRVDTEHQENGVTQHVATVCLVLAEFKSPYKEVVQDSGDEFINSYARSGKLDELLQAHFYVDEVPHRDLPPCQE